VIGMVVLCIFTCLLLQAGPVLSTSDRPANTERAVIVDHLSGSQPNPGFVKEATALLKEAGYRTDYCKDVTVEFYRKLPTHGYKIIILRVHSAYIHKYLSLAMFTSEPYSKRRYVYEQLRNRVAEGHVEPYRQGDPRYLVITDKFVRYSMEGSFDDDTIIIMMGCTGIKKCAATAFLQKGAKAYIGWDGPVSANHTDFAATRLLKHLLNERETIAGAVARTMEEVGKEPQYQSTLLFWPVTAGKDTITLQEHGIAGNANKNIKGTGES